jgi:two-component system response regulator PilR (NtrC family)
VLAATNRDLAEQIREGEFRRDLYERLAQVVIRVPPLRERSSDIPLLLGHFTDAWNRRYKERKGFTPEARRYLSSYPWPGNVRELQNAVSTACALAVSPAIGHELLPRPILEYFHGDRVSTEVPAHLPEEGLDLDALLFQIERGFYVEALERTGGNAEKAAALLGLNGPAFRKAARSRLGILS